MQPLFSDVSASLVSDIKKYKIIIISHVVLFDA